MDTISDHSLKKSSENVFDSKESNSTNGLCGIVNNGTTVELDEVNLRNGINECNQIEVFHSYSHTFIQLVKLIVPGLTANGCIKIVTTIWCSLRY